MSCLICRQAEIVAGFTSVSFQRGKMQLIIDNVPAQVCPNCGDGYVEEGIAVRLLEVAEELSEAGMQNGQYQSHDTRI